MHTILVLIFVVFYGLGIPVLGEQNSVNYDLRLEQGRMNVAGTASFPIETNRHGQSSFSIDSAPQFGFFLSKNIELRSALHLSARYEFSESKKLVDTPIFWDLGSQIIYYFATPIHLYPYLGGGLAVGFMGFNIYSLAVIADFSSGLLLSLSENCALDIGLPLRIRMTMRSLLDRVQLSPGLIGIRYFF